MHREHSLPSLPLRHCGTSNFDIDTLGVSRSEDEIRMPSQFETPDNVWAVVMRHVSVWRFQPLKSSPDDVLITFPVVSENEKVNVAHTEAIHFFRDFDEVSGAAMGLR